MKMKDIIQDLIKYGRKIFDKTTYYAKFSKLIESSVYLSNHIKKIADMLFLFTI